MYSQSSPCRSGQRTSSSASRQASLRCCQLPHGVKAKRRSIEYDQLQHQFLVVASHTALHVITRVYQSANNPMLHKSTSHNSPNLNTVRMTQTHTTLSQASNKSDAASAAYVHRPAHLDSQPPTNHAFTAKPEVPSPISPLLTARREVPPQSQTRSHKS